MERVCELLCQTRRQRVSDGAIAAVLDRQATTRLVLVLPQLGDFDSMEYAWWVQREAAQLQAAGIVVRAVGIGDRHSGLRFCHYTGFDPACLFVDPTAALHRELGLYEGLTLQWPGLSPGGKAWVNLLLMCAGIGSPGTLAEVLRGYTGDRTAPQLFGDEETIATGILPPLQGKFFQKAGGSGFQRPFELATLRLRNMVEVLRHWRTYVPDPAYLTQRGGTFLFDDRGALLYEHRDRGLLGFAAHPNHPLAFLAQAVPQAQAATTKQPRLRSAMRDAL